jgi:hypothetical protein
MIVPKDARALLHYRRRARPRHLRVLRGERTGDADPPRAVAREQGTEKTRINWLRFAYICM